MAEWDTRHLHDLKALFEYIKHNKQDEALDLIGALDVQSLNILMPEEKDHLVSVLEGKGHLVSVLTHAVQHNRLRVVLALLEKKVDVNLGRGLYGISPVFFAIIMVITPLYDALFSKRYNLFYMLLEYGADPLFQTKDDTYPTKVIAWNGRCLTTVHVATDISFYNALGHGGTICSRILQYSNVFTEFGNCNHTCLCYAMKLNIYRKCYPAIFQCIQRIIEKGGVVCSGKSLSTGFATKLGIASSKMICNLFCVCLHVMVNENDFAKAVHRCLSYICATDYVHKNSILYNTLASYSEAIKTNKHLVALDALGKVDSTRLEQNRQILTWIMDITKQPSTLKHICRVYIRRSIPGLCIEAIETLPLPDELIDYVTVVNEI